MCLGYGILGFTINGAERMSGILRSSEFSTPPHRTKIEMKRKMTAKPGVESLLRDICVFHVYIYIYPSLSRSLIHSLSLSLSLSLCLSV